MKINLTFWRIVLLRIGSVSKYLLLILNCFGVNNLNAQAWIAQTSEANSVLKSINFVNDQIGWAVQYGTLIKTVNGGNNWITQPAVNSWFDDIFFIDNQTGWVVARVI